MLAIFERHHDEILRQCSSACETFIFHCELMLTAYILVQFRTQMVNIIRKIYGLLHPFSSELFTGLTWLVRFFPEVSRNAYSTEAESHQNQKTISLTCTICHRFHSDDDIRFIRKLMT